MAINYDEYLQASNGIGEAVRANVVVERLVGSIEINVDSVLNWPNKFIATSGLLDNATDTFDPTTVTVFYGHINGTYIRIDEFAPGYTDRGNAANEIVVIKPTTPWADKLANRVALPTGGTDGQVLTKQSATLGDAAWEDLPNLSTWVPDQGLAGTVNGTNKVFTTALNFAAIIIYADGITLHVGDDYTITGPNQVTFVTAPVTGVKLTCTYVTSTITQLVGTTSVATDQPVTGLVNGVNKDYYTPTPYVGGSLEFYIGGQKQVRGIHFTETNPATGLFTSSDAPLTNDVLSTNYQIALAVTGNADTLDGIHASATASANKLLPLDSSGRFPGSVTPQGFKILKVTFNNGTTTRSTYNSNPSTVAIPGATGDTSYTAPCDVDIHFTLSTMLHSGTAVVNTSLGINGVSTGKITYYDALAKWSVQTVSEKVSVNAGQTITIGAMWFASTNGQASICNNNTDSQFANIITGIVIPRVS